MELRASPVPPPPPPLSRRAHAASTSAATHGDGAVARSGADAGSSRSPGRAGRPTTAPLDLARVALVRDAAEVARQRARHAARAPRVARPARPGGRVGRPAHHRDRVVGRAARVDGDAARVDAASVAAFTSSTTGRARGAPRAPRRARGGAGAHAQARRSAPSRRACAVAAPLGAPRARRAAAPRPCSGHVSESRRGTRSPGSASSAP